MRPDPVVIDGVDHDRRWTGSAVFGRRGTGWRPRRDPPPAPRVAVPQRTRDNGPMTKSELIHRIAQEQSQLVERDVELAVKMMLDQVAACLAGGGRIEIRGFGSFSLRFRRAWVGRDPRTGTPVSVPARYTPYFKPGKKLCERVDREPRGLAEARRHAGGAEDPQVRSGQ